MVEGLYYEDFILGKIYHSCKRTITETDLINFSTQCGFFEPLFMDQVYVETESPFKRQIAPGALAFSFAEGLTLLSGSLHHTGMAFLGVELAILKPLFIRDTISVEWEVIEKRETKKASRGIITFLHRVINQTNEIIMEYKVKRMIRRKAGNEKKI
jgi:acyl dehydratase